MPNTDKNYFGWTRPEMLPYIPTDAKYVLEVGCSSGFFGKLVKEHLDCRYVGIEPDQASFERAKANLDEVHCGVFEDIVGKLDYRFDCIVFNDVLEHLIDPWESLRLCKKVLAPKGKIVSSIPNFLHYPNIKQILKTQDWKYSDSGILDRTHFRFFTRKSIIRMYEDTGYEVTKINGIHPYISREFDLLNFMTLKRFKNMRYLQFASTAQSID